MKQEKLLLILISIFISFSTFAQSYKIKGTVTDTFDTPLIGATVVLLTAQDSILTYFTSADDKGNFILGNIPKGQYIFQASFTSYDKFEEKIDIQGTNKTIKKGIIKLKQIAYDLKTVEIEGERVPVQFINDTLIYDANAFDPGKNTSVEDLLKKMPGIEVNEKGDIKAQGKEVKKVTVDGKEFFGNDPKMATQNLPAEAVEKVKVFDKKSDFTELTGIDDGKEEKTIDLELKEDHKNGIFGKVTAGYGTKNSYSAKANINRFSPKARISLIGKTNNTSKKGFDFSDLMKMNGGFQEMVQSDGSVTFNSGMMGTRDGINKPIDAGININYTPVKKLSVNTSYYLKNNKNFTIKNYSKENFIPNLKYKTQNDSESNRYFLNHNANAVIKYKFSKNSKFKWNIRFTSNNGENDRNDTLFTYNETNILENDKFGFSSDNSSGLNASSYITYSLKLKKEGRSIFTKLAGNYSDNTTNRYINSINKYYSDPEFIKTDSIYQEHKNLTNDSKYNVSLAYTEPMWKMTYLILDLKQSSSNNKYNRDLYNRFPLIGNEINKHEIYNSNFDYSSAKISFKYNGIMHQFDFGIKYQNSIQEGNYVSENKQLKKNYIHWLPSVNYSFKISMNSTFKVNYKSDIKSPSILQLMPIVDNSNPQYIVLGNTELEPEKNNTLRMNFSKWNSFDGTHTWLSLQGTITENTIVNSQVIDELYRTTTMPINTGLSKRASFYTNHSRPLKFISSKISFNLDGGYNQKNTLINGLTNDYQRYNYSIGADIHNYKNKYVTGKIGVNYGTTISKYSINTESDNTYNNIKYFANLKWKITNNIKISNSIKYKTYSNKYSENSDNEILWDASLKFFLKEKRYTIKLSANDLLNQTLGYQQYSGDNFVQYTRTNRIGRYFMVSLTYSLSKFKAPRDSGVMIIIED
jgi:hypothetical protein